MSALWSARVVAKDNRRIVIELRAIHPDSGEFQDAKRFALRLLYDEAYGYDQAFKLKSRGPLGDAITLDQTFEDAFMDGVVDRFVERVAVDVQRPRLDVDREGQRIDRELAERGIRREDGERWKEVRADLWDAFWKNPDNLPVATYTIDVTDPLWAAHLEVGSTWESAAY